MRFFMKPDVFMPHLRNHLKCGLGFENGLKFLGPKDQSIEVNGRNIKFNEVLGGGSKNRGLRGPTGAMTTTIAFVDAALSIYTSIGSNANLAETMSEYRLYMPKEHREQLMELEASAGIRNVALFCKNHKNLTEECKNIVLAYDDAITATAEFRVAHIDHLQAFIFNLVPDKYWKEVRGTGGTPVIEYLCNSAIGTLHSRLDTDTSNEAHPAFSAVCIAQCAKDIANDKSSPEQRYCRQLLQSMKNLGIVV